MKVTIDMYTKMVLGVVLNSKYTDALLVSQKDELFAIEPGKPCEVNKNTLNVLFAVLTDLSDDKILWQVDDEEKDTVYKLQLSGEKWERRLNNHLELALNLDKLPKLWERA